MQVRPWKFTDRTRALWRQWETEGACSRDAESIREPNTIPSTQGLQLDAILNGSGGVPLVMPNELCSVVAVNDPTSNLHRQLQSVASVELAAGTMIPWAASMSLPQTSGSNDAVRYEFELSWRQVQLIAKPDMRCAATYVKYNSPRCFAFWSDSCCVGSDYCGPDRSPENKIASRYKLNCHIVVMADQYSRPYIFLQISKNVDEGAPLWIDYGDSYWAAWKMQVFTQS